MLDCFAHKQSRQSDTQLAQTNVLLGHNATFDSDDRVDSLYMFGHDIVDSRHLLEVSIQIHIAGARLFEMPQYLQKYIAVELETKACVPWYSTSARVLHTDDRTYMCSSHIDDLLACVPNNEMSEDIRYIYTLARKEYHPPPWVVYDVDSKHPSGRCDGNPYTFWSLF